MLKNLERESSSPQLNSSPLFDTSSFPLFGTVCRKASSCLLKTSTDHFLRFLIGFGSVLKRNTELTEEPSPSLRIFGCDLSMFFFIWNNLPSLSLFLSLISPLELRFGASPSMIVQRYIIRYLSLSSAFRWVHVEFLQHFPVVVS